MKIGNRTVKIFKIENRRGYAAVCDNCLTEGNSRQAAYDRMVKAVRRMEKRKKR